MYIKKQRIIIIIIIVISIYIFNLFMPTIIGNEMIKYINNEEIVKITCIIENVEKDNELYNISDNETISFLHDYFYRIDITRTFITPYFKNTDNFLFYIYDKNGNIVIISSHISGYNGEEYLYIRSNKWYKAKRWYKVKEYNNSSYMLPEVIDILSDYPNLP